MPCRAEGAEFTVLPCIARSARARALIDRLVIERHDRMLQVSESTYEPLRASLDWAIDVLQSQGMDYVLTEKRNSQRSG